MSKKTKIIENFSDPLKLFEKWFMEAIKSEASDPNAMNLATISKNFKPSSRIVLLKNFDKKGFVFYTNLKIKKSLDHLIGKVLELILKQLKFGKKTLLDFMIELNIQKKVKYGQK